MPNGNLRHRSADGSVLRVACVECDREFDLMDEEQAEEWFYGHDCEPVWPEDDVVEIGIDIDERR